MWPDADIGGLPSQLHHLFIFGLLFTVSLKRPLSLYFTIDDNINQSARFFFFFSEGLVSLSFPKSFLNPIEMYHNVQYFDFVFPLFTVPSVCSKSSTPVSDPR